MNLSDLQKELIEKIGVALECKGQRPAAARILGLLYVADDAALSFEEITAALQLSKSAISNALTFLLQGEQLEYITHTGDRKRYFRLKVSSWQQGVLKQVEEITGFSQLLGQVLAIRTHATPAFNAQIQELNSFLEFIADRLPHLLQEWKSSKSHLSV